MGARITCSHCGGDRDTDLSSRCPSCGSKQFPLIGYLYPQEGKTFQIIAIVIIAVLVLAVVVGVIYARSTFFF